MCKIWEIVEMVEVVKRLRFPQVTGFAGKERRSMFTDADPARHFYRGDLNSSTASI